ncbi:MAG: UDP-N-acetylmuramoyl-L-alanine--D-glutamate ligase [Elusimicrobiota bacterium]|jgi:UDP-N-acetylmuramoylalanine--D-glutamate ligase|nr:UDP-N-acetylmuramoyl-L-alanine--D-glutamate ligase [Elusimicrobiota bacterium]
MKKKIGILGLGKSGVAAANLAVKLGFEVFASDSAKKRLIKNLDKKVNKEFDGHTEKLLDSQLIIKSPGIHSDIPIIKKAVRKKIRVISELKFGLEHSKYSKVLAVSGTNGKTTVTDLLFKMIKSSFKNSIVCGNIGLPLSDKALQTSKKSIITLEVSSYQLEDTPDFKPDISVLLNIAKDHIEHHKTLANYIKAKKIIFANQTPNDFAVLNFDDKNVLKISASAKVSKIFFTKKFIDKKNMPAILRKYNGKGFVFYDGGRIIFDIFSKRLEIKPKIKIVGLHNIENILAASAAAFCAGVSIDKISKTISSYNGVKHRIEFIKTIDGVNYYNDSKSTNVDSTRVALNAFDRGIWLIMGGQDKKFPYAPLAKLIKEKVKGILLIGEARNIIKKDLIGTAKFYDCYNVENAVKKASELACSGDIVLLSPACASWDQFKNFEERGDVFRKAVERLKI